jgi:hypothetical protein
MTANQPKPCCCPKTSPLSDSAWPGARRTWVAHNQNHEAGDALAAPLLLPSDASLTCRSQKERQVFMASARPTRQVDMVSKNSRELAAAFSGGAASKTRGHHVMVATNGPGRAVSETTGPPGTTPGGRGVRRASRSARPMRVTKFCP